MSVGPLPASSLNTHRQRLPGSAVFCAKRWSPMPTAAVTHSVHHKVAQQSAHHPCCMHAIGQELKALPAVDSPNDGQD